MKAASKFTQEGTVTDLCHDWYGKRLATCSLDKVVRVYDKSGGEIDPYAASQTDSSSVGWRCVASWRAHQGSVWRVTWAHPQFGQLIASCSFDRTVAIWEEAGRSAGVGGVGGGGGGGGSGGDGSRWVLRAHLLDSRDSVSDVKFAPPHMGLKVATASEDGHVRVYGE